MENGLPGKGIVLTQISNFWFEFFADKVPHHLISTDVRDVPGLSEQERQALKGRIMLCKKTEVVPIECIARGYITEAVGRTIKKPVEFVVSIFPRDFRIAID